MSSEPTGRSSSYSKQSRLTVTRRHTGRYYIGLSQEDYLSLAGFVHYIWRTNQFPGTGWHKLCERLDKAVLYRR